MNPWERFAVLLGVIWAASLLTAAALLPPFGTWTIDDGVKRIAAEQATGFWAEKIPDGPVRSKMAHPEANRPLNPPFADRDAGALIPGFSPWTRAFFRMVFHSGETASRLIFAMISVAVWILFEGAGIRFSFLLLPLTFYGLSAWEYSVSWLLLWPAVWIVFLRPPNPMGWIYSLAGVGISLSSALRPECTLLLAAPPLALFIKKQRGPALWMIGGIAVAWLGLLIAHDWTAEVSPWIQFSLNFHSGEGGLLSWCVDRLETAYGLLIQADRDPWISILLVALFILGALVVIRGEKKISQTQIVLGVILLTTGLILYQYRLWSSPLPVLTVMSANSMLVALPWMIVLALPPYRNRLPFMLGLILLATVVLSTPVWLGVHWGPRLLLILLPLFIVDLVQSKRARGIAFSVLLAVTLVQTVGSATLVYARLRETSDRVVLVKAKMGTPVVFPTTTQCADYTPLWSNREFFTASNARELRRLMCEMRFAGVDSAWLHTGIDDPLWSETFPDSRPVVPVRITMLQAKSLYTTQWRIYELALNRADTLWAGVLETAAGEWLGEKRFKDALRFQREAVRVTPASAVRHHNLALILADTGLRDEALEEIKFALDLNQDLEESKRLFQWLAPDSESVP